MVHVRRQMLAHFVGLFQAREHLLCAARNDYRLCLRYDSACAGDPHDVDRRAAGQDLSAELVTHPVTIWAHIRAAPCRTTDTRQVGVSDPARRGPNRAGAGSLTPPLHTFSSSSVRPGRHRAPASLVLTSRNCSLFWLQVRGCPAIGSVASTSSVGCMSPGTGG